ncbi:MAG: PfkB family carbohydrate kinase [Pseudanabaenaceae cyanobacterium SKYGB_i_bin29]|nr:bifunctional ADP-heptose synthase [Pseudanabaenaceae cyanobacterium SKYG29]MDW8420323.1 PfkB family carbohydrate kinase [Pseudanabaenaceae cyanobacterium SKYGB_i_bin29]
MSITTFLPRLQQLKDKLLSHLYQFQGQRVMVVGDLTLDEFMTGSVERVSREAPVLILRHEHTRQVPGGGANAVYNLAKLGGQVLAVGIVGDDEQGRVLRRLLTDAGIDTSGVIVDPDRPTVTKTRISGHSRQSVTQQIVRVDRKSDVRPKPEIEAKLADVILAHLADVRAVVCSDYNEGVFMPQVISAALQHSLTVVDAQQGLPRYQGATIFTPNIPEAERAVGYAVTDNLRQVADDLLQLTQAKKILLTRGEEGMSLFDRESECHIPAFNRTEVFDVTGAGDTVVAALTLTLAAGGDFLEGAILGNLAASIVVRQFGTSTTNITEMEQALLKLLEE